MGHSDNLGTGNQNPKPSHSHSKPVNDKLTYRLFPTANQQPQVSPKTLQQQTLQRNASFNKRRSVSLDESSRPHGVARMPFSRPGDSPVPRLQNVPANRVKVTKPDAQDRTCTSPGNRRLPNNTDSPKAHAPKILVYKPRISEDAGHGRSSSAPDDMRPEVRARKPTGLAHMTNAALTSSAKAVRGLGGTWYNPHDSTIGGPIGGPIRGDTQGQHDRRDPKLEKPLPLPPRDLDSQTAPDPYHNRSHSTPLSPGPRSAYHIGARSDSVTGITPLVTPSSMDPNRKSYFPLSADAQMRQLMGFSPVADGQNEPARFHSREKSRELGVPYTLPSSRYQRPVDIPTIKINTKPTDNPTNRSQNGSPETLQPVLAPMVRPSLPSPTFSQASVVPAALRITSPKRSASVSSSFDRRPLPLQTRLRAANDPPPTQAPIAASAITSAITPKAEDVANTLSVLSELTSQTDTLHARYASLREDRQTLLSTISHGLKEQKAGPDYVNTIFDQHMSLSTVCSSMDICLAKLKAVARRKDTLIQSLVKHTPKKPLLPSIGEQKPTPPPHSARSTPAMSSSHKMSLSTPSSLQPLKVSSSHTANSFGHPEAMRRFHTKLDIDYDTDDSDAPRRMNIKGAKAAKILGLSLEDNTNPDTRSSEISATRPVHTLKANHSTTSLDRDHFTRTPSPAPAPDRPLPARPSVRMKQREHVPAPLPLKPVEKSVVEKTSYTAPYSVNDSAVSSRASSPADERGAETPHEEYPAFDAKSPGMQTVHVYFPESMAGTPSLHSSTFSEVGEDELLAYYGYLR
jgi:hypothetical protein